MEIIITDIEERILVKSDVIIVGKWVIINQDAQKSQDREIGIIMNKIIEEMIEIMKEGMKTIGITNEEMRIIGIMKEGMKTIGITNEEMRIIGIMKEGMRDL